MPADANAGLYINGMDMSGGGDLPPQGPDASLPAEGNFGAVPELQQVPQMPQAPQPQAAQGAAPATPPGAAGVVPNDIRLVAARFVFQETVAAVWVTVT